ncbi:MAG TPA: hypothetical protein VFS93_02580 [Terrimesophilobacter sp.]|nr:hypothetical protein [Terrimesophilobacter sp.]
MSPTSTDGGRLQDVRRFRRTLTILVTSLLVLCGTFFTLDWFQGPRLSDAQVDTAAVAALPGQQLRLFANEPLADIRADQVTVAPEVPFDVSTSGAVIAIRFTTRLDYSTEYRVTIAEAAGTQHTATSTLEHRFTTAAASVYYLDRADPAVGGKDTILRTGIGFGPGAVEKKVVYSADRIQDFAVVGRALVVVTMAADRTGPVTLVSLDNGATEQLRLPPAVQVQRLRASPATGFVGFILTGQDGDPNNALMLVDLGGTHEVTPVAALDGSDLGVLDWMFLPGTSQFIAQTFDQTVLLFDAAAPGVPTPIGTWTELDDVSPDGSALLVKDAFGSIVVSLADGTETRITPSPVDGEIPYSSTPALLPDGHTRVQSVVFLSADLTSSRSFLVVDDGTTGRIVYTPPDAGAIDSFTVSPNGQYAAVAVDPDAGASASDAYYPFAKPTNIMTIVVDLATGEQVRSYDGFDTSWP